MSCLEGIQLDFTNEVQSPLMQSKFARRSNSSVRKVEVNSRKRVAKISMLVHRGWALRGIRLIDENENYIIDTVFNCTQREGDWITRIIPEGQEIIGIVCSTSSNTFFISHIAFLLWRPPPTYLKY